MKCRNYTHATEYLLPVAPSPNLPTARAVYLYAALCPFEGTVVSLGRGTDCPFEIYGHPDMTGRAFSFTPRPTAGAKHPPLEGRLCHGVDLRGMPLSEAREVGFSLRYVIDAYRDLGLGDRFFTPMFEKLVGVGWVRPMIRAGASDEEIRAYIATGEPMDKAGAYAIQGLAAMFVIGLDGDYYNVMGLPVCPLAMILRKFGVKLLGC